MVLFAVVLSLTVTAHAAVRVVDDEVFFTLEAPGARNVFLVGSFNNWNPTVEPMPRTGDVFEISLYLTEGSYRYKFVVDGRWTVDPDNPGSDPAKGSPLVLVEKPAGLALGEEEVEEVKRSPGVAAGVRYIGDYRWRDGDFESDQVLDVTARVDKSKLRASAVLKTIESSWDLSQRTIDVTVDRGFVETEAGGVRLRAFENDTIWTSADPIRLIGNVGVYDYNAGFDRKGVTAVFPLSEAVLIRGMFADRSSTAEPTRLFFDARGLERFAGGTGADTTVYAYHDVFDGSDVLGFEVFVDAHDFQLGYTRRRNDGIHRGHLAEIERADSLFTRTVFDTRESWSAAVYWLRLKRMLGVNVSFGYGRGDAKVDRLRRGAGVVGHEALADPSATPRQEPVDADFRFQTSDRFVTGAEYRRGDFLISAGWDLSSFDFDRGMYEEASARVQRGTLAASYGKPTLTVACNIEFTDQNYNDTPADLTADSPSRNFWLDGRDEFDVPDIVAFDDKNYLDLSLEAVWTAAPSVNPSRSGPAAAPAWLPTSARLLAGTTAKGIFEAPLFTRLRIGAEKVVRGRYVAQIDGRVARYGSTVSPKEPESQRTFLSGYAEVGYRTARLEVNIGYGFDPVVFDPVVNGYSDIGRTQFLRQALGTGLRRGDSASARRRLISLEKALGDVHTIKLECILRF